MGSGAWDSSLYDTQKKVRRQSGVDDFDYDRKVHSSPVNSWKCHDDLDPKQIKDVRESRDSDEHPETVGIVHIFDVTGSMGGIPRVLQQKLKNLMAMIIAKGGIEHPQICSGAIGDATSDRVPFQIGQFESDNRIDDQLRNIFLEGNGGGQMHESYALAYYFAARKTALDCVEKRGKKGYLFITGDELPYDTVSRAEAKEIFGDTIERDLTIEELIAEASEKFEIFHIIAAGGYHGTDPRVKERWQELLNERVYTLDDPEIVCEFIASIVAIFEGLATTDDVTDQLGLDRTTAGKVSTALTPLAKSGVPTKATVTGDLATTDNGPSRTKRL